MSKAILFMGLLLGTSAMAETTKVIQIDVYPYLGTFASTGFHVESQLNEKVIEACGSLENVKAITELKLQLETLGVSEIDAKYEPGEFSPGLARFTLAYPRTTGEATVICK